METGHAIADLAKMGPRPVMALGVFDGLHRGHQKVISRAATLADEMEGTLVVATFDPHPAAVLSPGGTPLQLTSRVHYERILASLGVPCCLVIPFDKVLAAMRPEDFLAALRKAGHPFGGVVTGEDFTFGKDRAGCVCTLAENAREHGYRVISVPAVEHDGVRISSTRVRKELASGNLEMVTALLGRMPSLLGVVEAGDARGRQLGFPTANLPVGEELCPPHGVYAVDVRVDGTTRRGVANLGCRPTVEAKDAPLLEVHLLDFDGDLYGREIEVFWRKMIRGQEKFPDLAALTAQIRRDVEAARL